MALRVASSRLLLELPSAKRLGSQGLRLFSIHHESTADIITTTATTSSNIHCSSSSSSRDSSSTRGGRSTSRKGPVRFVPLDAPEGTGDHPQGAGRLPEGRPRKYPSSSPANETQAKERGGPQPARGEQQQDGQHRHDSADSELTFTRGARISLTGSTEQGRGSLRRAPGPSNSLDMASRDPKPGSFRTVMRGDDHPSASLGERAPRAGMRAGFEDVSEQALGVGAGMRRGKGAMLSDRAGIPRASSSVPSVVNDMARGITVDNMACGTRDDDVAGGTRDDDVAGGMAEDEVARLFSGEPSDRKQWQEGVLRALETGAKMPWERDPASSTGEDFDAARLSEEHSGGATWQRVARGSPAEGDPPELARATNRAEFREAKDYALRLLGSRVLPEASLRQKLKARGVSARTTSELLEWLKASGLQDDAIYAEAFANSRLRTRLWSPARIALELRRKGVAREVIDRVIAETCSESGPTSLRPGATPEAAWLDLDAMNSANELSHAPFSTSMSSTSIDDCDSHSHSHSQRGPVTDCDAPGSLPVDVWRKLRAQCRRLWAQYNRKDPSKAYHWLLGWLLRRQHSSEVIGAVMKDVQGSE